jgi:hypothetical protein
MWRPTYGVRPTNPCPTCGLPKEKAININNKEFLELINKS